MTNANSEYIERLQNSLTIIRKVAGWSAEELGDLIGVTKQTISNLENKKTPMTLTQYIAIRAIIDYEIENNLENKELKTIMDLLVDCDDSNLTNEEKNQKNENVQLLAKAAAGGLGGAALTSAISTLISSIGVTAAAGTATLVGGAAVSVLGGPIGIVAGATIGSSLWLKKVINDKKRKKGKK